MIIKWFKKWFKQEPREWTAQDVDHEDSNVREMLANVMNSGKTMVGSYDEKGNFTVRVVEDLKDKKEV